MGRKFDLFVKVMKPVCTNMYTVIDVSCVAGGEGEGFNSILQVQLPRSSKNSACRLIFNSHRFFLELMTSLMPKIIVIVVYLLQAN